MDAACFYETFMSTYEITYYHNPKVHNMEIRNALQHVLLAKGSRKSPLLRMSLRYLLREAIGGLSNEVQARKS
jgi:hypothetical protein